MRAIPKTLVILIPGFPIDESDSNCLPAQQQFIRILQQQCPELRIMIITAQYPKIAKEYYWHNIKVISLNIQGGFYKRLAWMRVWKALLKVRSGNQIAGLLCFWCNEPVIPAFWFARTYHIPRWTWIMGQDAKKHNYAVKLIHPKPVELIALSDFIEEEFLRNNGIRPSHVIPLGINKLLLERNHSGRKIDILGAGSLIFLKRYDLFLKIVKYLSLDFPDLQAVICGKGVEENSLRTLIKELQIEKNLYLTGEVSHETLLNLMSATKLFIHPSSYEGFSSSCLEAIGSGTHVISFHKPMMKEIPHWHIVNNFQEMCTTALALLENAQLCDKPQFPFTMQQAAERVRQLFGQHLLANPV